MKIWLIVLAVVAIVAVWAFWPTPESNRALKERELVAVAPDVQEFMEKTLEMIRKNNLKGFFRLMSAPDEVRLEEYRSRLFAAGDFCPAAVIGAVKLKNGPKNLIAVRVKSEKRDKVYQFNLVTRGRNFAIAAISADSGEQP